MGTTYNGLCRDCQSYVYLDKLHDTRDDPEFLPAERFVRFAQRHEGHRLVVMSEHMHEKYFSLEIVALSDAGWKEEDKWPER